MKGIFSALLIFTFIVTGTAFAQSKKQYNNVKDRIKKELNLDDAKADTTATILKRFFNKVKTIRENETMSNEEKQLVIKKEKKEQVARLRTFLTEEQLKKLRQMVQQYKDMRQKNNDNPSDTSLSKYYF